MGMGRGVMEGVQMAGSFVMPAMQLRQQQRQFDAKMEHDYDRMALEKAWIDSRRGVRPEAPSGMAGSGGTYPIQQPYQVTMDAAKAPTTEQFMGFSDPTKAAVPSARISDWDPVNAPQVRKPAVMSPAAALAPQPATPSMGLKTRNPFASGPIPTINEMRPRNFGRRY